MHPPSSTWLLARPLRSRSHAVEVNVRKIALDILDDGRKPGSTIFSFPPKVPATWRALAFRTSLSTMVFAALVAGGNAINLSDSCHRGAPPSDRDASVESVAPQTSDATRRDAFADPTSGRAIDPNLALKFGAIDHALNGPASSLSLAAQKLQKAVTLPTFNIEKLVVTDRLYEHLKSAEGLRLDAYQDDGGTWTIGYGHTGSLPDGKAIKNGSRITQEEAEALLRLDVAVHSQAVRDLLGRTPVSLSQFEALVDFSFNKGATRLETSSLLAKIKDAKYLEASDEFERWIHVTVRNKDGSPVIGPNGKPRKITLAGLEARAQVNKQMMLDGLPDRVALLLEDARQQAQSEVNAHRLAINNTPALRLSGGWTMVSRSLQQSAQGLTRQLLVLNARELRQGSLLMQLKREREHLTKRAHAHSALTNTFVSGDQASDLLNMVGQISVINRVIERMQVDHRHTLAAIHKVKALADVFQDTADFAQGIPTGKMSESEALSVSSALSDIEDRWAKIDLTTTSSGSARPLVGVTALKVLSAKFGALHKSADAVLWAEASPSSHQSTHHAPQRAAMRQGH